MHATPTLSRFRAVSLASAAALAFSGACAVDAPESTGASNRSPSKSNGIVSGVPTIHSVELNEGGYFEFQVDSPVTFREGVNPRYPSAMKAAGISGRVWAQFVVDETGRVEMPTFKVLKSAHPEFTAAVKEALSAWRLNPAVIHGKKVKQLVQQEFVFGTPKEQLKIRTVTGKPNLPPGA